VNQPATFTKSTQLTFGESRKGPRRKWRRAAASRTRRGRLAKGEGPSGVSESASLATTRPSEWARHAPNAIGPASRPRWVRVVPVSARVAFWKPPSPSRSRPNQSPHSTLNRPDSATRAVRLGCILGFLLRGACLGADSGPPPQKGAVTDTLRVPRGWLSQSPLGWSESNARGFQSLARRARYSIWRNRVF